MTSHIDSGTNHDVAPTSNSLGVAVVAVWDGSGLHERTSRSCWTAMEDYTALLTEHTAIRASVVPVTSSRPYPVATRISELPEHITMVFLMGLDATKSAAVQSITAATGQRLVLSETDALTATAAAATVTALRRRGIPPRHDSLAVVGADRAPGKSARRCQSVKRSTSPLGRSPIPCTRMA